MEMYQCIDCKDTCDASEANNLQCPTCGGNLLETGQTASYAVMIRARYQTFAPQVWITHLTCDTLREAREEQTAYELAQKLLPGQGTTVCVYHSREWERLVR